MNKKIITSVLLFLVATIAYSQRFDGGALLGFNASQVKGDTYNGYHKPGLVAGFYVETDISPVFFAAMEIKYSQKGARKKVTDKDPTTYIMRLNYIDIPLYAAFRSSERTAIIGGISPGVLLSGKEFNEYGEFPAEEQNAFSTLDLQAFLGMQLDFADNLKIDLRFAYSVLPIRDEPTKPGWYWESNQFNNVITLALYYQIGGR